MSTFHVIVVPLNNLMDDMKCHDGSSGIIMRVHFMF